LTAKGADVFLVIQVLAQIGDKWGIAGQGEVPLRFVNRNTGQNVRVVLIDEKSGCVVPGKDVRMFRKKLTNFEK
jgi:hypothetical protein